jgi:hypothetical protein
MLCTTRRCQDSTPTSTPPLWAPAREVKTSNWHGEDEKRAQRRKGRAATTTKTTTGQHQHRQQGSRQRRRRPATRKRTATMKARQTRTVGTGQLAPPLRAGWRRMRGHRRPRTDGGDEDQGTDLKSPHATSTARSSYAHH